MTAESSPSKLDFGFSMEWCSYEGNSTIPEHYHDFYEFFLFLGTSMLYFLKDRSYTVGRNGIVMVDANTFHHTQYTSPGRNERLLISFDKTLFDLAGGAQARERVTALFRNRAVTLPIETGARVANTLLRDIYQQYNLNRNQEEAGKLRAALRLVDLLLELTQLEERRILTDAEPIANKTEDRIAGMVHYIDANYTDQISLEDMSTAFYIDKYYMCHIFKKATGLSIIEFTNRKRLAEAERKLKNTAESVTSIAMSVGFNNSNHFTELFKSRYGTTPGRYRRQYAG